MKIDGGTASGPTLRQHYAGLAMVALMAHYSAGGSGMPGKFHKEIARESCDMADALLAELEKKR